MNPITAFLLVFLLSLIAFATFGLEFALSSAARSADCQVTCPTLTFGEAILSSVLLGGIAGLAEYSPSSLKETVERLKKDWHNST